MEWIFRIIERQGGGDHNPFSHVPNNDDPLRKFRIVRLMTSSTKRDEIILMGWIDIVPLFI